MNQQPLIDQPVPAAPERAATVLQAGAQVLPLPKFDPSIFNQVAAPQGSQPEPDPACADVGWTPPRRAAPVLLMALNSRWQAYRDALYCCDRKFSERAVHELRVATRRLMAQLVMLSSVSGAAEADRARRVLKRRLKALGALRDAHVLRTFAEHQTRRFPELLVVRDFLERRELRLEKAVAAKVKKFKRSRKLERWVLSLGQHLARRSGWRNRPDRLNGAVLEATAVAFHEVVRRRNAIDPAHPKTVHRTRIAFKRFRYMVEALSPDFTALQKSDLRTLARYQRRMGNLQDLEVMQDCLAGFVQDRPKAQSLLEPFHHFLQQRRRRVLRSFLKSADQIFSFWPPPAQRSNDASLPALSAA